jgi:nitrate reductase gamma subunit
MEHLALLTFVRGPALDWSLGLCAAGIILRLFETLGLGRKADLAKPRDDGPGSGWQTIFTRSIPPAGMFRRDPLTYVAGYVFHFGLLATIVLFVPHIEVIRGVFGVSWPGLPGPLVDVLTVASLVALILLLVHRFYSPVKRLLSGIDDYLSWVLTFLPLLTGYLAFHHLLLEYTLMLAVHIISVELLLVILPFTKLFHSVSLWFSRWYNGDINARKGVAS